jgi:hypothetical protein
MKDTFYVTVLAIIVECCNDTSHSIAIQGASSVFRKAEEIEKEGAGKGHHSRRPASVSANIFATFCLHCGRKGGRVVG